MVLKRNQFILRSPLYYLLKHADSVEELKNIKTREVDSFYDAQGNSTLKPYEMCERMYLVVKTILNKGGV